MMKGLNVALTVFGAILVLAGAVFFLQGIDVITTRSFMRGDPNWAIYGGIMVVIGIGLLLFANWKRIRKK